MPCQLPSEAEQIAQQLRLIDLKFEQMYPGYLEILEQLRQPREYQQEGEWNKVLDLRHNWNRREEH